MIRALWFAFQIAVVVYAAMWVADRPGSFHIEWLDYEIDAHIGVLLGTLLIVLLCAMAVYKGVLKIINLPKTIKSAREKKRDDKGLQALTLGLSAVAAGDAKLANYQSYRAKKLLSDNQGLSILLAAQAARLNGDEVAANKAFQRLLENKDTAFLGLRGLLLDALQSNKHDDAELIARKALSMYPKQPWLLRTVFDLEIKKKDWAKAEDILKQARKAKAFTAGECDNLLAAFHMQYAAEHSDPKIKIKHYNAALKADAAFAPASIALAGKYIDLSKLAKARTTIEKAWKIEPHPDLADMWRTVSPYKVGKDSVNKRFKHWEKLVSLNPAHYESQIAAADAAITEGLWDKARMYLEAAEKIDQTARLYQIWARLEEGLENQDEAYAYFEKAANAKPDKIWVCVRSGNIYAEWQALAPPHGAFNSIIWDYPQQSGLATIGAQSHPENEILTLPISAKS